MGFFSDLKEDLSQAVNELMPEDEQIKNSAEQAEESAAEMPAGVSEEAALSLDEMLQNIENIKLDEEDAAVMDGVLSEVLEQTTQKSTAEPVEAFVTAGEAAEETVEESAADEINLAGMLDQVLAAESTETEIQEEENKGAEESAMEAMETMENSRVASDETSVITEGMVITGDITTEGSIDVIGTVNGNIDALGKLNITGHITGNSKAAEIYAESAKINGEVISEGAVKIGASSVIIGNITATSAAIAGAVKGDIDVRGPVVLDASAIVMGNIKSKSVQINNGAVIEGMCSQCYADVSPTSFFDDYKPEPVARKSKSK